jgi:hypothetical protein
MLRRILPNPSCGWPLSPGLPVIRENVVQQEDFAASFLIGSHDFFQGVQPRSALELCGRTMRICCAVANTAPAGFEVLDRVVCDVACADVTVAAGGRPRHLFAGLFGIMDHFRGEGRGVSDQFLCILTTDKGHGVGDGGLEAGDNFCT